MVPVRVVVRGCPAEATARPHDAFVLLETLFWLALLLGALAAPIGWPFRLTSVGFGALRRRHGLDPAATHRVRRAAFLGQAAVGDRERAATPEWAATAEWAGFVVTVARRGGSAPVLLVLFALVAAGPRSESLP